ncbi:peptidoglycan D,D-transpeptidase FtsI family protein [Dactylosporangium matsuzakiense]|uniref:Cell division protein n=1 Tax=Dactylosporangium matsuzakiense TaxID=53360 RepID=A0A9W6NQ69_9ACTN|nr:penicillin-binding protein 2 [Dactylosporangium matsuzakiense]UWZ43363.1 penicillin-binding protein 2 [Dactylosporangium matsuzakiense]GLL05038.1 cell division protein [Dactylosporangium matsuzakiense]
MSEAKRYTPRGRSVRDASAEPRRGDPFRPALEVLQGGRSEQPLRAGGRRSSRPAVADEPVIDLDEPDEPPAPPRRTAPPKRAQNTQKREKPPVRRVPADRRGQPVRKAQAKRAPVRKKQSRVAVPRLGRRTRLPKLAEPRRRLRLATVLCLAMFAAIGVRLVQLQLTDASAYAAEGLKDRLVHAVLPASRGAILDRNGKILVHSVETRYVAVDPTVVKDPEALADKLFAILDKYGVLRSDLVRKMTPHKAADGKTNVQFEYLVHQIDVADGDRIRALHVGALKVDRDERREIPGYDLASNIIGYTSRPDLVGQMGIEKQYDSVLKGVDGLHTYEHGEGQLDVPQPYGYEELKPARPGSSVELTIDQDLQYSVQKALADRMEPLKADFASAIVLDAKTMEVMAMASYPSFAATGPGSTDLSLVKDQCTATVFDPGSIHKAIVMGAALQEGVITPSSTITVNSTVKKGDTTYTDHPPQKNGTQMTIPGILALSSNVGTIAVADRLGKDKLYEYQQKFGLGQRTGVGLPNESPGQLLPPNQWSGSSPGSIPIGNGVATTAMQMAAVYGAIANDGLYVQPTVVKKVIAPDGTVTKPAAQQTRRVLDPQVAQELRVMLEGVTTLDDATGKQAAIPGYRIAGKTGTSKLPQSGGYASGDVVSFIGMAPAEAPRYVIAVNAHVPGGAGGSVAAPAFKEMMALTLSTFGVTPTGTEPPKLTIYP